jgi:hypothetical protein
MDGVRDAVCRDAFADPMWMLRLVSHLADHYFITVAPDDDDRSQSSRVARRWQARQQSRMPGLHR